MHSSLDLHGVFVPCASLLEECKSCELSDSTKKLRKKSAYVAKKYSFYINYIDKTKIKVELKFILLNKSFYEVIASLQISKSSFST